MTPLLAAALLVCLAPLYIEAVPRLPAHVESVTGEAVDLAKLARSRSLVVVTVKNPSCPVCAKQLQRIQARLPELKRCGLTFVVLGPGPAEALASLREATGFPYPFVADADLKIAESLGLRLGHKEISPAILIARDDLSVGWIQRGRNAQFFGDGALADAVECWMSAKAAEPVRNDARLG